MSITQNFCIVLMHLMYIGSRMSPTVCFTSPLNPIKAEDFGRISDSGIFIRFSVSCKMMFADDPPSIRILLTNKLAMCKVLGVHHGWDPERLFYLLR